MRPAHPENADGFWTRRFTTLGRRKNRTLHRTGQVKAGDGGRVVRAPCGVCVAVRTAAADDDDTAETLRFSPCADEDPALDDVPDADKCRTCFGKEDVWPPTPGVES